MTSWNMPLSMDKHRMTFCLLEVVDAFYFKNADARLGLWNIENKLLESQLALFLYTRAPTELKLAQKHHYWLMLILTWKDYGIARQNIKLLSGHQSLFSVSIVYLIEMFRSKQTLQRQISDINAADRTQNDNFGLADFICDHFITARI